MKTLIKLLFSKLPYDVGVKINMPMLNKILLFTNNKKRWAYNIDSFPPWGNQKLTDGERLNGWIWLAFCLHLGVSNIWVHFLLRIMYEAKKRRDMMIPYLDPRYQEQLVQSPIAYRYTLQQQRHRDFPLLHKSRVKKKGGGEEKDKKSQWFLVSNANLFSKPTPQHTF